MYRLIPIGSFIFNFAYFYIFVKCLRMLIPNDIIILGEVDDILLAMILYIVVLMILYTRNGQRFVAFCANGRNTIGREEKKIQPIINELVDNTDIGGYSSPIIFKYKVLSYFNSVTLGKVSILRNAVERVIQEYKVGTVKLFTFDSLDIESNSFGNSIFLAKGAIDNLPQDELKAVIYNEFAQVKYNISNKRLLHQSGILIARLSCLFTVILIPIVYYVQFLQVDSGLNTMLEFVGNMMFLVGFMLIALLRLFIFYTLWKNNLNFTNVFYMFYERNIFLEADRATEARLCGVPISHRRGDARPDRHPDAGPRHGRVVPVQGREPEDLHQHTGCMRLPEPGLDTVPVHQEGPQRRFFHLVPHPIGSSKLTVGPSIYSPAFDFKSPIRPVRTSGCTGSSPGTPSL